MALKVAKKHIININFFSVKQPYSLMLSLIRKMESRDFDNLKTNEFWEVFLWIENFTFAFNLSGQKTVYIRRNLFSICSKN